MDGKHAVKIGLVGYGYWGPNLARNFNAHPQCRLVRIADTDSARRLSAKRHYPSSDVVSRASEVTRAKDIDVVVIATPASTHFSLAMDALKNGKHVWIEKPMTSSSGEGERLIEFARKMKKTVLVDHTFLFTGAVRRMKALIDKGELGKLYCYDSTRVNLGLFQHDINVIWDLAPHDISIMNYLVPDFKPVSVNAVGIGHFKKGLEDVGYLTVRFRNNFMAHFHVSWLSPVKIRKTLIAGDRRMVVWDDLESDSKVKIYDNGVEMKTKEGIYRSLVQYRLGDMLAPRIEPNEALEEETRYFIDCLLNNKKPINDAHAGLKVVKILEASDRSLKAGGREIRL